MKEGWGLTLYQLSYSLIGRDDGTRTHTTMTLNHLPAAKLGYIPHWNLVLVEGLEPTLNGVWNRRLLPIGLHQDCWNWSTWEDLNLHAFRHYHLKVACTASFTTGRYKGRIYLQSGTWTHKWHSLPFRPTFRKFLSLCAMWTTPDARRNIESHLLTLLDSNQPLPLI